MRVVTILGYVHSAVVCIYNKFGSILHFDWGGTHGLKLLSAHTHDIVPLQVTHEIISCLDVFFFQLEHFPSSRELARRSALRGAGRLTREIEFWH